MRFFPWNNTDPDAAAYIAAVQAAGGTVTATQSGAINTFIREGKTAGWWASLQRIYLPIWAVAAPNAICMKSLTSGTFTGSVTHSAGFVQSDASTGFFNTLHAFSNVTTSSAHVFALCQVAPTIFNGDLFGVQSGAVRIGIGIGSATQIRYSHGGPSASFSVTSGQLRGAISQSTTGVSFRRSTRTGAAGVSHSASSTTTNSNPTFGTFQAMRTGNNYNNAGLGSYGVGDGLSDTNQDLFTVALKNLYETSTGIALP